MKIHPGTPKTEQRKYKSKSKGNKNALNSFKGSKGNNFKSSSSLGKEGRIIVRNLPFMISENSLKEHFCKFGTIKDINLLRRPDGKPVGCAFIEYDLEQNARKAIETCSGKDFMGRTITAALAVQQSQYVQSQQNFGDDVQEENSEKDDSGFETKEEGTDVKPELGYVSFMDSEESDKITENVKEKPKTQQKSKSLKKGRIIVRNISFKATENDLQQYFSEFGELNEVALLRKPDGKLIGCGFIQFTDKKNAAKAIVECSGKAFLGRPIVLDWALAKTAYTKINTSGEEVKVKEELLSDEDIKKEVDDDDDVKYDPNTTVKSEDDSDDGEDSEDNENVDEEEEMDEEEDVKEVTTKQQQKFVSNDVSEGKTVFVKNIPFSANNKDFKECMEQFGEVEYALVCYDRLTEHSKGTGFVKYKNVESAQTCLSAGTELTLQGQVLDCHKALDRETVQTKGKKGADNTPSKDSRNLYLVKEGVVLAGSKAAASVSVTDMAKRLQLEQLKTQMLRNLNMFISATRLVIHNLPPSYDDGKLFQLFKKHSKPGAFITESKVMRDMINIDESGVGKSKEMGFVTFTRHDDALTALRNINNHPDIFTVSKRPIVSFAIENRMVHKVRQQREQKSREKNPLIKKKEEVESSNASNGTVKSRRARRRAMQKLKRKLKDGGRVQSSKLNGSTAVAKDALPAKKTKSKLKTPTSKKSPDKKKVEKKALKETLKGKGEKLEFTGVAAERGDTKLRTKYNLKTQATLHVQTVRKDMKKKKSNKLLKLQKESIRQPKQKKGKGKGELSAREEASFNELVNKYKSKMVLPLKEKKWYEPDK